ncbi:MAG: hypothetical protein HYW49_13830 [Deltaproteobacteria bacterium]|nr:hypothetical protein [Deltaproteobacteria bacterium]
MSNPNFSPRFIKARVTFRLDDTAYDLGENLVNPSGVPGAAWDKFDPIETMGKKVQATLNVRSSAPFTISCPGTLTCEQTEAAALLGVSLNLSDADTLALSAAIEKEGILPEYIRAFPRIPYAKKIGAMTAYAILRFRLGNEEVLTVAELNNVSPSGFQVMTEDHRANALLPGENMKVMLVPRGETFNPINLAGKIRRVTHSADPVSGNMRLFFGVSIGSLTDYDRSGFTVMLRRVVGSLKA